MGMRVFIIAKWRQIFYSLIIVSSALNVGFMIGWSVEVTRLVQEDTFNATTTEYDWLVSSAGLASIFTTLSSGFLVETFGPCRTIHFMLIPAAIAWLVMALSETYTTLLVGRIITGGIGYMLLGIVQPFIAEICQADVRGFLSSLPQIAVSTGLLLMYLFARFFTWQTGTLLAGLMTIPMIVAFMFVPESPYFLIKKGNLRAARSSLKQLRVPEHDFDAEVTIIKEAITQAQNLQGSYKDQFIAMKDSANHRPIILLATIFIFRELGGALVIFNYAAYFFQNANVPLDPFTATVLVGVAKLLFHFVAAFTIDRVGRRPLFIGSSIVCSLMMFTCTLALHFQTPSTSWIPFVAVLVFVSSFGIGSGVVPWVLLGELLPTPVRSLGSSICLSVFCVVLFLVVQFFIPAEVLYGLENIVLAFGVFHLLAGLTAWLFLPETRKRTLEDLQTAFAGAAVRPFRSQRDGYLQTYGATYPETSKGAQQS